MRRPTSHRPPPLILRNTPAIQPASFPRRPGQLPFREPEEPKSSVLTATFNKAMQLQRKNSLKTKTPKQRSGVFRVLRVVSETTHSVICMFLMLMMAFYMNFDQRAINHGTGSPAIGLMVILSMDMLFNFYSIAHFDRPVPGWSALTKCFLIFGYMVIFLDYLANDGPFPADYSFWDIKPAYTSVIIYVFIWIISVWDLAVIVIYRQVLLNWLTNILDYVQDCAESHDAANAATGHPNKWYRDPRRQVSRTDLESGTIAKEVEGEPKAMEATISTVPFVGKAI